MRAISLPDLEARLSPAEASKVKRDFMVELLNRKADWLDMHLKKIIPPEIYAMAHDQRPPFDQFEARQEKVKKWLKDHDIRMEEQGLNARLFRGKVLISQFFVKLVEK